MGWLLRTGREEILRLLGGVEWQNRGFRFRAGHYADSILVGHIDRWMLIEAFVVNRGKLYRVKL